MSQNILNQSLVQIKIRELLKRTFAEKLILSESLNSKLLFDCTVKKYSHLYIGHVECKSKYKLWLEHFLHSA